MSYSSGDMTVRRTATGYVAVLRVQGVDGSYVGLVGSCTWREARAMLAHRSGAAVGFSFAGLARGIARAASSIAKSKVFKTFLGAAKFLPPPISTVAHAAGQAATVLAAMKRGEKPALAAWQSAAARARAAPSSPTAAAMRLAMEAHGPPVFRSPTSSRATELVREVLAELERSAGPSAPRPAQAQDANPST